MKIRVGMEVYFHALQAIAGGGGQIHASVGSPVKK